MKISEIEQKIIKEGFSEKLFLEFQNALKRVPKNGRCQHCYTTAYCLKDKDAKSAIHMIKYGLESFDSDWVDKMRAYQNLGYIYEACAQHQNAKVSFESALSAVPTEMKEDYAPDLSLYILRAELHCTKFKYSEYAYQLYKSILRADEFSSSFRSFVFYRAIMEIILAKKNNNLAAQKTAYIAAVHALDGDRITPMDLILKRHKFKDDAKASKEAIRFLKSNKL